MSRRHIECRTSRKNGMRILHVMASRANGGAETYSADMMASLHAAGVEQVAVIPRASIHHDRLAAAGVPLAPDVLDARFGLLRRRRLAALIDGFKPDLVHCWMRRAASLVPPLAMPGHRLVRRLLRARPFPPLHALRRRHARHRRPHDRARRAEGQSPLRADLPDHRGRPAGRSRDLATPADATVLLTLSRLHEKKGLDILLAALADLPRLHRLDRRRRPAGGRPEGAGRQARRGRSRTLPGLAHRPRRAARRRRHLRAALALGALRHRDAGSLGGRHAAGCRRQPGSRGPDRATASTASSCPSTTRRRWPPPYGRLMRRPGARGPLDRTGPRGLPEGLHARGRDAAHDRPLH